MQEIVRTAATERSTSVLATVVGGIPFLFGASTVFGQLQSSLNAIPSPNKRRGRVEPDRAMN